MILKMSNNSLVRQLKIDLITDTPNDIITWFNELWSNMHVIEVDVYEKGSGGAFIYYIVRNNENRFIFFVNYGFKTCWCANDNYWEIIERMFSLDYIDIQYITKILLENNIDRSIMIPTPIKSYTSELIDKTLYEYTNG